MRSRQNSWFGRGWSREFYREQNGRLRLFQPKTPIDGADDGGITANHVEGIVPWNYFLTSSTSSLNKKITRPHPQKRVIGQPDKGETPCLMLIVLILD